MRRGQARPFSLNGGFHLGAAKYEISEIAYGLTRNRKQQGPEQANRARRRRPTTHCPVASRRLVRMQAAGSRWLAVGGWRSRTPRRRCRLATSPKPPARASRRVPLGAPSSGRLDKPKLFSVVAPIQLAWQQGQFEKRIGPRQDERRVEGRRGRARHGELTSVNPQTRLPISDRLSPHI